MSLLVVGALHAALGEGLAACPGGTSLSLSLSLYIYPSLYLSFSLFRYSMCIHIYRERER